MKWVIFLPYWCYPDYIKRGRGLVEIFLWNWIKAAAERIYFLDDSIKWQLWHNIKVQKYRLEMRHDFASNLSQSETDWTQNYGERGRESIMWEGGDDILVQKKSWEAKFLVPCLLPSVSPANDTRGGCENCMVRAKPLYTLEYFCVSIDTSSPGLQTTLVHTFSKFIWIWILKLVMVNGDGYHLRVPSKMIIIKNLDDQDHYDHDDDDQDVDEDDHFAEAKRLLEIRSRARFRPMNGEVLHVGQRTTEQRIS